MAIWSRLVASVRRALSADRGDPSLDRRAGDLLKRLGKPGQLPAWPSEEQQKQYTASHGRALMRKTIAFVDTLERHGAFETAEWRGLDYGCGWGRIATVMLTKGRPDQLDLCDAWPATIELLSKAGFANRVLTTSELVGEGELAEGAYDFIYSYSVFTHLRQDAFENNLARLVRALRPAGKLFVTVRHADHMRRERLGVRERDRRTLARRGFWFRPSGNSAYFGTTVVERSWLEKRPMVGALEYLGKIDGDQHLYLIGA